MVKTDLVALTQQKRAEEYSRKVAKKRRIKKVVTYVILATFFIAGWKIVGDNDLKAEKIVMAKETEIKTEEPILNIEGKVWHKNFVETDDGFLRPTNTTLPEGTEVIVYYNDNGTVHPKDDHIYDVVKK